MTTLTLRTGPLPAAARLAGWAALLPLALLLRVSPRAALAAIPGGPTQADLGFGLGGRRAFSR
ncbi:hypothetical protein [Methylobacterium sp. ID0610]|uniref:hypothetical protein n=1 Tax=Methylobacterium carpenticola TaxID=3344827 RepID=UPI00369A2F92